MKPQKTITISFTEEQAKKMLTFDDTTQARIISQLLLDKIETPKQYISGMPNIDEIEDFMEDLRAGQNEPVQQGHKQKLLDSVFKAMQDIGIKPRIKKDGTFDRRVLMSPSNGRKGGRPAKGLKATAQANNCSHKRENHTISYNTILSPSENLNTSFEDYFLARCRMIFKKMFKISYEKTTDKNQRSHFAMYGQLLSMHRWSIKSQGSPPLRQFHRRFSRGNKKMKIQNNYSHSLHEQPIITYD